MKEPKNLIEVTRYFADENLCREHLEKLRWNGTPACPFCGSVKIYRFSDKKRFKCGEKECNKKFTVTVGTVFENTKVPLQKWFVAMYLFTSHKKGISSIQLSKDISVKQQTAWFMLHRLREVFREKAPQMLTGVIEMDEVYVGGKIHNMTRKNRKRYADRRVAAKQKTAILAMVRREDKKVRMRIIENVDKETVRPIILANIKRNSVVYTDSSGLYVKLWKDYNHDSVSHENKEFVRGEVHTNTIEGFFSWLKRAHMGIYHYMSRKHLSRYCDEVIFRYERREQGEIERFNDAISLCDGRLKYNDLIQKKPANFEQATPIE